MLPLPPGQKHSPPSGYTGAGGLEPDDNQIEEWRESHPDGNIALRLPDDVIGIDVDDYNSKRGADTLDTAIATYGNLPATWSSTARGQDSRSRISYYRVPAGVRFPGKLEIDGHSDVEIIQHRHRYAVAPPSVHPNGETYRWYRPDGQAIDGPPYADELPRLPDVWVAALARSGDAAVKHELTDAEVEAFIDRLPAGDAVPCFTLKARLSKALRRLEDEGSRHDSAVQDTLAMLGLAVEGHQGGWQALKRYGLTFLELVAPDRGREATIAEFDRMLAGAVAILAHETIGEPCACDAAFEHDERAATEIEREYESEQDDYRQRVELEKEKQRIRRDAKRELAAEEAITRLEVPTFKPADRFVFEAESDLSWRITDVIEQGATVGFFAAAKVGKSTVLGNLAHSLLTGEQFLGQWDVERVDGSVTLIDLELSANRLRTWLKRWGNNVPKLKVTSLRGQASNFNIVDETHFARLVEQLKRQETEVLIVDPLGPLLRSLAIDENDPTSVGIVLDRFSALKEAAGISEVIVSHHAGHDNKDRPRGASTFMDWPDVMLLMRLKGSGKFTDDAGLMKAPRVLSALGRDVDVPSIELTYDPESGTVTARTRAESDALKRDTLLSAVIQAVRATPGISQTRLKKTLREHGLEFTDGQIPEVIGRAIEQQYITRVRDKNGRVTGLEALSSEDS